MKTIFVDLDNTLAANETCQNVEFTKGLYLNKKPIQIVIDAICNLYKDDNIIIMSRYVGDEDGKQEKMEWIKKYLPDKIKQNSPFLIKAEESKTKCDYIIGYAFLNRLKPSDCIIIDDNKKTLQECDNHNIISLYPQQVICKYEEILRGENNDKTK